MSRRMGKWYMRRGAACALSVMVVLSITACSALQGTGRQGTGRQGTGRQAGAVLQGSAREESAPAHSNIAYSQRPYEHYDPSALEGAMADFEQACAVKGQDEEILRLYGEIADGFDRLAAVSYMAQLAYDSDVSDEAAEAEQAYTMDLYSEMGDKVLTCLQKGMESSYKKQLTELVGRENAPFVEYYQGNTQEMTDLNKEEQELIREYEQMAAGGVTVELEDGQWSYSRLETEPDISSDRYTEVEDALAKEKNRVLGAKYIELAQVRRRIAEYKGYDNYAEYVYEGIYGRDYSMQDADKLCANVKEQIVSLNEDIWYKDIAQESYDSLDGLEESSTEDILDTVGPVMEAMDPELGEIFRYMTQNGLYDIQSGEDEKERTEGSYTVGMPGYGDAFIFITRNHTFMDYQSLIHEFGHFSTYYYNTVPELFQGYSVDVSEVQSQGLEILADRYAEDMFGEGSEAYEFESITDMLYVTIMACMLQEFEEAVYTEPYMSLEDMNRKFKEIQDSYGAWYCQVYDGDLCYDWVDISHLFYTPMYYIGYGTSALSSLDLWTMTKEDWDGAVTTYMGILKEGMDAPYRETMYQWGMRDIFDEKELKELAGDVRRLQGLNGAAAGEPESDGQDGLETGQGQADAYRGQRIINVLMFFGIGTVIVLQITILCIGIAILWLLVKRRES